VEKGTDNVIGVTPPASFASTFAMLTLETKGKITSGCPSPTLGKNIAMGYVRSGFHKQGTEVGIKVRGKERNGTVTKMPFVETKYYKAP